MREIKSEFIDILNKYNTKSVSVESIKSMASVLGFADATRSIENAREVEKDKMVDASTLPSGFDTEFAKASLLKSVKGEMIMKMVEQADKNLYSTIKNKLEEIDELAAKAVSLYEKDVDITLTDIKTMLVAADKDQKLIDDVLNTKLEAI